MLNEEIAAERPEERRGWDNLGIEGTENAMEAAEEARERKVEATAYLLLSRSSFHYKYTYSIRTLSKL